MSTSASFGSAISTLLAEIDPRVQAEVLRDQELARTSNERLPLGADQQLVLVGHRAAGKSRLLPHVGKLLSRPTVDLDSLIAQQHGRALRAWVADDPTSFRSAERKAFSSVPLGHVIAVGGGFLSMNADLLVRELAVLVPVSFRTYRERLLSDTQRPRLRPQLSLEEELRTVFRARQFAHREVPVWSLGRFLGAVQVIRALESAA